MVRKTKATIYGDSVMAGRQPGPLTREQKDAMAVKSKHKDVLRSLTDVSFSDLTPETYQSIRDASAYLFPPVGQRGRTGGPTWAQKFLAYIKEKGGSVKFMEVFNWSQGEAGKPLVRQWIQELIRNEDAWITDNGEEVGNQAKKMVYTLVSEDGEPAGWTGYVYSPRKSDS